MVVRGSDCGHDGPVPEVYTCLIAGHQQCGSGLITTDRIHNQDGSADAAVVLKVFSD